MYCKIVKLIPLAVLCLVVFIFRFVVPLPLLISRSNLVPRVAPTHLLTTAMQTMIQKWSISRFRTNSLTGSLVVNITYLKKLRSYEY